MFGRFFKQKQNQLDAYGVMYLHVQKDGKPFCILNIGNALCRVIGETGYGITFVPNERRFCVWGTHDWDFANLEQEQRLLRLEKQSASVEAEEEAEEERSQPDVFTVEEHGTVVRVLLWRNASYAVEFHSNERHCLVQWWKEAEGFGYTANLFGDPSIILEFAEQALNTEPTGVF
jgi:hypothetical protein